jgi:hypothetical protein
MVVTKRVHNRKSGSTQLAAAAALVMAQDSVSVY